MARRKIDYRHYVDSDGVIHASGPALAVNSGLCGDNNCGDYTDEPVTCRACVAVDAFVRDHNPVRVY